MDDAGEIKGFMCSKSSKAAFMEWGAWVRQYEGPLALETAIESIARAVERFGFVRMEKPM